MSLVTRAIETAHKWHGDQKRRGGEPYTTHLERVASSLAGYGESVLCVAWLHDIFEDTECTGPMLRADFPDEVVGAVVMLTRSDKDDYNRYIRGVATDPIARIVKIADMLDNLCDTPTQSAKERYRSSILFLSAQQTTTQTNSAPPATAPTPSPTSG